MEGGVNSKRREIKQGNLSTKVNSSHAVPGIADKTLLIATTLVTQPRPSERKQSRKSVLCILVQFRDSEKYVCKGKTRTFSCSCVIRCIGLASEQCLISFYCLRSRSYISNIHLPSYHLLMNQCSVVARNEPTGHGWWLDRDLAIG